MSVNLDLSFDVENGLTFSETDIAIFSGTIDPAAGGGTVAPRGSLFLRDNGALYIKDGPPDTSWTAVLQEGDVQISVVQPTAGLTISGGPIVTAGTLTFTLANDLAAVEGLTTNGFAVRSSSDTWATRSLSAGINISITNADGTTGNPLISLSGIVGIANGGTGLGTLGSPLQVLRVNADGTALEYASAGNGTVTSVAATAPAQGFTISGSPITSSGTLVFTLADDLAGLEALTTTGISVRTGASTWSTRSLVQPATGITITNADGVAGNPTFSLANDLAALEGLTGTGFSARTGADTWANRTIQGTANNIVVTNGTGVSGNPVINLAAAGTAGTYGSATQVPVFTTDEFGRVTAVTNTNITFPVTSVFGRTGAVVAAEGDYTLNLLGDVTLTSPATGQILQYNGSQWVNAAGGGTGTVTSVAVTGSTGLTVGGTNPITTSGTITLTLDTGLQNLASFNTTGIVVATGADAWVSRALVQPAAGITITNANGVAGNPTFALANDLAALEGLTTTGIAVRTGADTWANRTIQGTANQIAVTNGSGAAGDPTVAIAANPIIPGTGSIQIPAGTTAERTSPASNGMIRYNTTKGYYEAWNIDRWVGLALFTDGGIFQLNAYTGPIPATSGTSTIPFNNTAPLITEGTEIWSRTITPERTTSRFITECMLTVDLGTSNRVLIISIFRDSVNLGSALFYSTGGGRPTTLSMKVSDIPGTTSPVTFSMRAGVGAGTATWYINSNATGNNLGGALVSQYEIREFSQ